MKISKELWIDKQVKWNVLRKRELYKANRYKGHAYIVCTSPHKHLLFEIVEARFLSNDYAGCTVLALCHTRQQGFDQVRKWVDKIYNQQIITYTQL